MTLTNRERERDSQRSKVYAAEKALKATATPLPRMSDLEDYVSRVWREVQLIQHLFPQPTPGQPCLSLLPLPTVKDGRGRRRAGGSSHGITMPTHSRNDVIVLHELAHTICCRLHGWRVAGHGWQFCAIYRTLVLHAMGHDAHAVLTRAFWENGVKFQAPKQIRITDNTTTKTLDV